MRYTYDNSSANPRNPHSPPIRVQAGNRSEDEMAHLWLQVLPVHVSPDSPDPRLALEEAWMRSRLRRTPTDRVSLYNLAAALSGEAKYAEAVAIYRQALAQAPNDALTLTALGVALAGQGDTAAARQTLQRVIDAPAADPQQACNARYDLASIDLRSQDFASAIREFRDQLAACPDDADSHQQLASAYAQANDPSHALAELRAAETLKPGDAQIHSALSQLLAAQGSLNAAIAEEKEALRLADNDPDGWNNLGVMQARAGQPEAARAAFEHALKLDPAHAEARANLARLGTSH
jgi:Flp pilus assembly protein TadD